MLAWQPCLGELGTVPQSGPMMAPYLQKWLTPQIRHQHDGPETGDVPVPPQNHCSRGPNIYHQSSPCSPDLFSSSFQLISSRLFMERLDTIQQEQNHLPNTWEKNRHRSAPTLSSSACPPHQGSKRCPSSCQKQTPGKGLSCKGNQNIVLIYRHFGASQVAQLAKNLPAKQETQVWSLGQEDPLEKRVATHSSILAWRIPWTEKPGRLYSMESQRVRHDWVTNTHTHTHTHTHRHLKKKQQKQSNPVNTASARRVCWAFPYFFLEAEENTSTPTSMEYVLYPLEGEWHWLSRAESWEQENFVQTCLIEHNPCPP